MRTDILERKEEILQWIKEKRTKTYMCKQLNCKPETLNSYLEKMGIKYDGQQFKKGQIKNGNKYETVFDYLAYSTCIKSQILKKKLIEEGIKEDKCEICGLSEWQGVKIPLELHHKDVNHYNNELDNLQILCPNCHAIQNGNSGAATGKTSRKNSESIAEKPKCPNCGETFSGNGNMCRKCFNLLRQTVERPEREEFKRLIRTTSFVQLGKKFGVSDKAIAKWCKAMNLPSTKREINSYSEEEWEKV